MSEAISIKSAEGTWVVRAAGAVIGETTSALELFERGHDPVIYFPRDDVEMAFFDVSDHRTTCPHKGKASYYSLAAKSGVIPDIAWSYEEPLPDLTRIKEHLAFHTGDLLTVEKL